MQKSIRFIQKRFYIFINKNQRLSYIHSSLYSKNIKKQIKNQFYTLHVSKRDINHSIEVNDHTKEQKFQDPKNELLKRSIKYVNKEGWSVNALAAGAIEMGYPSVAHGMFPRGSIELVEYFMEECNKEMVSKIKEQSLEMDILSVPDRLKICTKTRLECISPYISSWPQAMALGALPQNGPKTLRQLASIADKICYFAGDQSTDITWYTKRAVITALYTSTELFMITDKSENFEETWNFLDRRMEDAMALGESPQNLQDIAGMTQLGLKSIFSAVTSLAGPVFVQTLSKTPIGPIVGAASFFGNQISSLMYKSSNNVDSNYINHGDSNKNSSDNTAFNAGPLDPNFINQFQEKDLEEINSELKKYGGESDDNRT